jgi:hypothetical protein
MNRALILITVFLSAIAHGEEVMWQDKPVHKIDIDCDGVEDSVYMGRVKNDFVIRIHASSAKTESKLQFGLAQPSRQDAICGKEPKFATYSSDAEAQRMLFDEVFEGYKSGQQCFDLNISGGECDSITVFYNHKTQELNWWRL